MNIIQVLNKVDATLQKREKAALYLTRDKQLFQENISIIENPGNELSLKALFVLEIIARNHIELVLPYIPNLAQAAKGYNDSPSRRCLAKIFSHATQLHTSVHEGFKLKNDCIETIIELCFLWLLKDEKAAVKVFSMQNLFNLKDEKDWISTELREILEKEFPNASAAFKARARKLLRKL